MMNGVGPMVSVSVLFGLKATLVLGAGFLVSLSLRKSSASLRHFVWSATFVALLVLPLPASLSMLSSGIQIPVALLPGGPDASPPAPADVADLPFAASAPTSRPGTGTGTVSSSTPAARERTAAWSMVAILVWAGGAVLCLGRLGAGIVASIREVLRAREISDEAWMDLLEISCARLGIQEEVSLRKSDRPRLPMTLGLFHPTILLPESAQTYAAPRRSAVLLHELAHVRRRDCLTQFLAQSVSALYWWNPLVWLAARDMRLLSERAADDLVLGAGASPADYAHDLLEMARGLHEERFTPLASVAMAHRTRFEERLLAILDPAVARRGVNRRRAIAAGSFALPAFVLVALAVPTRAARLEPTTAAVSSGHPANEAGPTLQRETEQEEESQEPREPQKEATPTRASSERAPSSEEQESTARPSQEARDKARAALAEALDDPEPSVQQQALHALVEMRDGSVAPHLVHALESADPETRAEAAWGLGQLRDESAVGILRKALSDENADVREQAAWALGMIRSADAVEALVAAVADTDESVREQAAWALGMIRDPRAVPGLSRAVVDNNEGVREQAAWALGMLRVPEGYDALATALSDKSATVRSQAAWALGMLRDSRAIDALSRALKDEDSNVREQAAWALGMLAGNQGEDPEPRAEPEQEPEPRPDPAPKSERERERAPEPPHAVSGFTPGTVL